MYQVELKCDREALRALAPEWNELLADSRADTIFLSWEWIDTWWQIYGREYTLYLICVRDLDGRLAGIAPLKIVQSLDLLATKRKCTLEFIGYGKDVTPEYLDLIVRKGHEEGVYPLLVDFMISQNSCEVIDLRPMRSDSASVGYLKTAFAEVDVHFDFVGDSVCPVVALPDTWDEFLASRSKNFRKKTKEYERRCRRDLDFKLVMCDSETALGKLFDQVVALHHNRWAGKSNSFLTDEYQAFHRRIARLFMRKGWLRLLMLYDGEQPIAALYCFHYHRQFYYYQSGRDLTYDRFRVGIVILNLAMRTAIEEGAGVFDFLTGTEAYKFRWAKDINRNVRILFWRKKKYYLLHQLFCYLGIAKKHCMAVPPLRTWIEYINR